MNERQFNALRKSEAAARKMASRHDLPSPVFYLPNGDPEISTNFGWEAIADFMETVAGLVPAAVSVAPTVPPTLAEMIENATLDQLIALTGVGKVTAERMKGLR